MNRINRTVAAVGVSLSLFAMNSVVAAAPTKSEDEAAIRAILQGATDAYAKRDAVAAMAPYWNNKDLYVFDLMLPVYHMGYADNLRSTQNFIDGAVGPVHVDYGDLSVVVDHNHAYSHAVVHITADMKGGKKTDITDRTTDVWERRDGKWLIVHEHNSLALDPARGKELVNATPRKDAKAE